MYNYTLCYIHCRRTETICAIFTVNSPTDIPALQESACALHAYERMCGLLVHYSNPLPTICIRDQ